MKKFLTVMLSAIMLIGLTACGSKDGENDVLRVGVGGDPVSFDPHISNDQPSSRVRANIYEGLVYQDENLEVKPLLAKEWEINENTWTFMLEEGVKFHNGEEMKASDVVFSLKRAKASSDVGHLVEAISDITEVDDYKVQITTDGPYLALLAALSHPTMAILSEKAVEEQGDQYASGYDNNVAIGTAPYKFDSYEQGTKTQIVKFKDYWNEDNEAEIEKIIFQVYTDNSSRKLAVEAGDIDIAYDIANSDYDSVKNNSNLKIAKDFDLSYTYMGFNVQSEVFADARVREAVNMAIDVDSMIQTPTILNSLGQEANTPLSLKAFGWTEDVKPYGYNPEKAKELLNEAGITNLTFSIWTNENPVRVQIATAVQAQLAEIGVTVNIKQMEWGAYLEGTAAGEHEMYILGWTAVTGDADYGLYPMFHSSTFGSAGNRSFYSNPEVDAALEAGRSAATPEERQEAYTKAQTLIMGDYVNVPLWYTQRVVATRNNVEGFILHPAGSYELQTVSFSE